MPRLTPALLCSLATVAAWAAPAPLPRPWVTGWDRPIDPLRDCKFEREADRLTITVPGPRHELITVEEGRLNAPRLLRDAEGDFVAQVRVAWVPRPVTSGYRHAGLLVSDGQSFLMVGQVAGSKGHYIWALGFVPGPTPDWFTAGTRGQAVGRPVHLRLERRGEKLWVAFSEDRERWTWVPTSSSLKFSPNVKVGVVAQSTAPGEFRPWFDRFKLSRRGR